MSLTHYCTTVNAIAHDLEDQLQRAARAIPGESRAELAELIPSIRRLKDLTSREPADPDFDPPLLTLLASLTSTKTTQETNREEPTTTLTIVAQTTPRALARLAHAFAQPLSLEIYVHQHRAQVIQTPEGPVLKLD